MPYKDEDHRRQAARKWRLSHRAQRAAYMRRYRKARSSGRARGRPRSTLAEPDSRQAREMGQQVLSVVDAPREDRNRSNGPEAPPDWGLSNLGEIPPPTGLDDAGNPSAGSLEIP
jgi:hypothetical protein